MWTATLDELSPGRVSQLYLVEDGSPATIARVIAGWCESSELRTLFARTLRDAPFRAFFWEVAPLLGDRLDRPFECVLVDAPSLVGVPPDAAAFAEHFGGEVTRFSSLGGDAELIAPSPRGAALADYAHLAAFCRGAPPAQQDALWREVGEAVAGQLADRPRDRPLWVSTSGLGVYWLHVRLDERPKYYTHAPYRQVDRPT